MVVCVFFRVLVHTVLLNDIYTVSCTMSLLHYIQIISGGMIRRKEPIKKKNPAIPRDWSQFIHRSGQAFQYRSRCFTSSNVTDTLIFHSSAVSSGHLINIFWEETMIKSTRSLSYLLLSGQAQRSFRWGLCAEQTFIYDSWSLHKI